jgi:hypothetical protein
MKKFLGMASAFLIMAMAFATVSQADVLDDGDFELSGSSNAWISFGNAFPDEAAPGIDSGVEGAETLKMFGNFASAENFTGVFQDVAVDGTDFSVGDRIVVKGIVGHLSGDALTGSNVAFLEITFFDPGGLGEFGFGANTSQMLDANSATDQYFSFETTTPFIPVEAQFVRVKAVFIQQADNAGGAAWVDNITLSQIPEPGSAGLLAFGLLGVMFKRRRK